MANIKPRKRGRAPNTTEVNKVRENNAAQPPRKLPGDFSTDALRRYIARYDLKRDPPMTFEGFMLRGKIGKHSESVRNTHRSTTYTEASRLVNDHLRGGIVKEGDAIAEFLYAVTNRKTEFKLRFGETDKHVPLNTTAPAAEDAPPSQPPKPVLPEQ